MKFTDRRAADIRRHGYYSDIFKLQNTFKFYKQMRLFPAKINFLHFMLLLDKYQQIRGNHRYIRILSV